MRPQIVKSIQDKDGHEVLSMKPEVVREVIPRKLRASLAERSLKSSANVAPRRSLGQRFHVAGKTGTAQKVDSKGGYAAGKYVGSSVGYIPAEDPRFVCLILIDDAS